LFTASTIAHTLEPSLKPKVLLLSNSTVNVQIVYETR
jgi:hypothetical protein